MKATDKTPNYTPEQEARIRERADEGSLNLAVATELATEFGKTPRSVIAKITRMGLAYQRKQPQTKTGEPVVRKADLVAEIAKLVDGNVEGLEKASKDALKLVRDALAA